MKKVLVAVAAAAAVMSLEIIATPAAHAGTGICDTARKDSSRRWCYLVCDTASDSYNPSTCQMWEALIEQENGD